MENKFVGLMKFGFSVGQATVELEDEPFTLVGLLPRQSAPKALGADNECSEHYKKKPSEA